MFMFLLNFIQSSWPVASFALLSSTIFKFNNRDWSIKRNSEENKVILFVYSQRDCMCRTNTMATPGRWTGRGGVIGVDVCGVARHQRTTTWQRCATTIISIATTAEPGVSQFLSTSHNVSFPFTTSFTMHFTPHYTIHINILTVYFKLYIVISIVRVRLVFLTLVRY